MTPEEREARRPEIRRMIAGWPAWTDDQITAINAALWINHPNCQPAGRLGRAS